MKSTAARFDYEEEYFSSMTCSPPVYESKEE
jgi:hypothetical protein